MRRRQCEDEVRACQRVVRVWMRVCICVCVCVCVFVCVFVCVSVSLVENGPVQVHIMCVSVCVRECSCVTC